MYALEPCQTLHVEKCDYLTFNYKQANICLHNVTKPYAREEYGCALMWEVENAVCRERDKRSVRTFSAKQKAHASSLCAVVYNRVGLSMWKFVTIFVSNCMYADNFTSIFLSACPYTGSHVLVPQDVTGNGAYLQWVRHGGRIRVARTAENGGSFISDAASLLPIRWPPEVHAMKFASVYPHRRGHAPIDSTTA